MLGHMTKCAEGHTLTTGCESKWLYVANPGGGNVIRIDVTSGTEDGPVKPYFEWREGYYNYTAVVGAHWEVMCAIVLWP